MTKAKKIGFLGGTFDPFHFGHLNLALEVLEKGGLEEIWICPTNLSPFKTEMPPIDIQHRIRMIELAIEGIGGLSINEAEAFNAAPSFTYETLNNLCHQFGLQTQEITLIISDDMLPNLHLWHQAHALLQKFPIIVGTRPLLAVQKQIINPFIEEKIKNSFLPIRSMEISSSEIRMRLKNKLYCGNLLPLKTLDYIYNYKLYS